MFTSLYNLRQPSHPFPSSGSFGALGRVGLAVVWGFTGKHMRAFGKELHRDGEKDGTGRTYTVAEAHNQCPGRWWKIADGPVVPEKRQVAL